METVLTLLPLLVGLHRLNNWMFKVKELSEMVQLRVTGANSVIAKVDSRSMSWT